MQLNKYWSRIVNRISLMGKFRHLYRVKKARKVLNKLKEISNDEYAYGKIMIYMRKINPFVFEELILTVIEDSNIKVIRNKSYSNDGGIDGIFKIPQGYVLIQCKRYEKYINPSHVLQLSNQVKEKKYYMGIFVHTGKTGQKSKINIKIENNLLIISGSVLIDIILGKKKIDKHILELYTSKLSINS